MQKIIEKDEKKTLIKTLKKHGGAKVAHIALDATPTYYEVYWLTDKTMVIFCTQEGFPTPRITMFQYGDLTTLTRDISFGLHNSAMVKRTFMKLKKSKKYFKELAKKPLNGTFSPRGAHAGTLSRVAI